MAFTISFQFIYLASNLMQMYLIGNFDLKK